MGKTGGQSGSGNAHINNIDPNICFTVEPEINNKLSFIELCINNNILDNGDTKITVYHHYSLQLSVICTLYDTTGQT